MLNSKLLMKLDKQQVCFVFVSAPPPHPPSQALYWSQSSFTGGFVMGGKVRQRGKNKGQVGSDYYHSF